MNANATTHGADDLLATLEIGRVHIEFPPPATPSNGPTPCGQGVGLLTTNDGVVLSLADGSEFQITVVRSKEGDRE